MCRLLHYGIGPFFCANVCKTFHKWSMVTCVIYSIMVPIFFWNIYVGLFHTKMTNRCAVDVTGMHGTELFFDSVCETYSQNKMGQCAVIYCIMASEVLSHV